eukprot:TRINITY_DN3267_c0_g1_i2.p1 TRINITY_DN3267_c0_g1~~TRINITY_DN3267_c0_g1_i2.p1  ORF type:complete len:128 (+),score=15.83 TRINITY_DN3267_c0_g1_i2:38-421(+)
MSTPTSPSTSSPTSSPSLPRRAVPALPKFPSFQSFLPCIHEDKSLESPDNPIDEYLSPLSSPSLTRKRSSSNPDEYPVQNSPPIPSLRHTSITPPTSRFTLKRADSADSLPRKPARFPTSSPMNPSN